MFTVDPLDSIYALCRITMTWHDRRYRHEPKKRCSLLPNLFLSRHDQIWKSRISISTKLKLYNTCILPSFLCGSECWAVTKRDVLKIDALYQWCMQKLLGIKWYHHVWNDEVRLTTKQNETNDWLICVCCCRLIWRWCLLLIVSVNTQQRKRCRCYYNLSRCTKCDLLFRLHMFKCFAFAK